MKLLSCVEYLGSSFVRDIGEKDNFVKLKHVCQTVSYSSIEEYELHVLVMNGG